MDHGERRDYAEHGQCPGREDPAPGLRERKKHQTRDALCEAAVRLALSRGLENVRVPDIASEAHVSPRTYNNYFSSIPEAICAQAADRARALGDHLRGRPATEPLADALANAMIVSHNGTVFDKELVRMIIMNDALRGEFFKAVVAREQSFAAAIAERTGAPENDLYPQVLAAAYLSVTRVVNHRWLSDDNADFLAMLRDALKLLAPMATEYENAIRSKAA
jgi:AcrR family transcriptional regulator